MLTSEPLVPLRLNPKNLKEERKPPTYLHAPNAVHQHALPFAHIPTLPRLAFIPCTHRPSKARLHICEPGTCGSAPSPIGSDQTHFLSLKRKPRLLETWHVSCLRFLQHGHSSSARTACAAHVFRKRHTISHAPNGEAKQATTVLIRRSHHPAFAEKNIILWSF